MALTNIDGFERELQAFGVAPSAVFVNAQATRHAAMSAAASQPTEDLRLELADGKVTPANARARVEKAATALVVREKAQLVLRDLEQPLLRMASVAVADDAERIVLALRPAWDESAAVVAAAVVAFGANPDEAAILKAGPQAAGLWQARQESLGRLGRIKGVRAELGRCGYGGYEQKVSWFIAEATDAYQLEDAERAFVGTGDSLTNLANAGFELRLNTLAESIGVEAFARRVTAEAEAAERQRRIDETLSDRQFELDGWRRVVDPAYRAEVDPDYAARLAAARGQ